MKVFLDLSLSDIELIIQGLQNLLFLNGEERLSLNKSFHDKEVSHDDYKSRFSVLEKRDERLHNLILNIWK